MKTLKDLMIDFGANCFVLMDRKGVNTLVDNVDPVDTDQNEDWVNDLLSKPLHQCATMPVPLHAIADGSKGAPDCNPVSPEVIINHISPEDFLIDPSIIESDWVRLGL